MKCYVCTDLNKIFTLRAVSRPIKSAIDNHTKLWSLYLDKSDLATAKKQKISYADFFLNCSQTLNDIIKPNQTHYQKLIALKEAGIKNLRSAWWIVYHPKLRGLFLTEYVPQDDVVEELSDLDDNLKRIVQIGVRHESIALYLIKDLEFKEAFLSHKDDLESISKLAVAHKSVALFLLQEDRVLDAIYNNGKPNFIIQDIASAHEEALLIFFQNIASKRLLASNIEHSSMPNWIQPEGM
jgi:hypothetical protein